MLRKSFREFFKNSSNLYTQPSANFVIRSVYLKGLEYGAEPVMDLYAKRFRKIILDRTILAKDKLIIPAVRVRQEEDTLEKLRKGHLCAGVINARDEFPDLDLVFENRSIFTAKKRLDAFIRTYHVQVGNELIRCTLDDVQTHYIKNWLVNATFNRYIVGRPNLLYIPIKIAINKDNMYLNKGSDFIFNIKGVWVYSYNDDYPTNLEIDPAHITPNIGYRLGEIINILPEGCELHPKYKNKLNQFVLEITETKDVQLKRTLEVMEYYRKLKTGELFEFDEKGLDEDDDTAIEKKPKVKKEVKPRRKRPRSLKKIVASMDLKIKEGVLPAGSVTTGDGKKNKKKTEE